MINDILQRARALNEGMQSGRIMKEIIMENEAYICDMNSEEQLFEQGVNRLGVKISDYAPYSPVTIAIKRTKGQPTNRVTLRDEGDFHASFYVQADNEKFAITANDEKTEHLRKKYGRQIFGLTAENKSELLTGYIKPDLIKRVHEILL